MICALILSQLIMGSVAYGQLDVRVKLKNKDYLVFEEIKAELTIKNNTAAPFKIGGPKDAAQFDYTIHDDRNYFMSKWDVNRAPIKLEVPALGTVTQIVDLAVVYDLTRPSSYDLTGGVAWQGYLFSSAKQHFSIHSGSVLLKMTGGPAPEGGFYEFVLTMMPRNGREELFMHVNRGDGCLGVYDLGHMLRFNKPVMQIDSKGQIHILFQISPLQYSHAVFTAQGAPVSSTVLNGKGEFIASGKGDVEVKVTPIQSNAAMQEMPMRSR